MKLHGDKGHDNRRCRAHLRRRGICARIGVESSQRLGRHRWVVERTVGWLPAFKRLALRYDRTAKAITVLARLAVTLIATRLLVKDQCNVFEASARSRNTSRVGQRSFVTGCCNQLSLRRLVRVARATPFTLRAFRPDGGEFQPINETMGDGEEATGLGPPVSAEYIRRT